MTHKKELRKEALVYKVLYLSAGTQCPAVKLLSDSGITRLQDEGKV